MITKLLTKLALGLFLLTGAVAAQATPITYYLTGVTFSDGTSATGSFVFDADTKQSSAFDIVTTAGALTGFDWSKADSGLYSGGGFGANNFVLITFNGMRAFNFSFANALTNAGGSDALVIGQTYECYNCSPYRLVTAGSVTSAAVPEPATLALLLPALAGIGFTARRRKQTKA